MALGLYRAKEMVIHIGGFQKQVNRLGMFTLGTAK